MAKIVTAGLPPVVDLGENDDELLAMEESDLAEATGEAEATEPSDGDPLEEATDATDTEDASPETPEEPAEEPDAELTALKEKAALFEQLNQSFARSPKAFIEELLPHLSAADKAALGLDGAAGKEAEAGPPEGWADEDLATAPDFFIREHKAHIEALPKFQEAVHAEFQQAGQYLNHLAYQNAQLEAQLAAVLSAVGLTLPAASPEEIAALVQGGKSYQEAFQAVYAPKAAKVVAAKKAAGAAVKPQTPRNEAGANAELEAAGSDLLSIFRAVKKAAQAR